MNFLQKFLLLLSKKKDQPASIIENNPLGIRRGSIVGMDDSFRLMAEGSTQVRGLSRNNTVFSKGEIDLGEGYKLHRFYFDDEDLMLQIRTSSYEDNFVEEIILFNYLSLINISTQRELERLAGRDSAIGLPTYKLEGVTYNRTWGSEEGQTELVLLHEKVTNADETYNVKHMCMLYGRDTDLAGRTESLLLSVEESGGTNGDDVTWQISTTVGLTLFANDLNVL